MDAGDCPALMRLGWAMLAGSSLAQSAAIANSCVQKRLDRFTSRSKAKVDVQWRLFALVHNIGKIHKFGLAH